MNFLRPIILVLIPVFSLFSFAWAKSDGLEALFPYIHKLGEDHRLSKKEASQIEAQIRTLSYDGHLCNDHYHGDLSSLDDSVAESIISAKKLSYEIVKIANAFKIDSGMFASLLYTESQFCNFGGGIWQNSGEISTKTARKSYTGALGLGQFTTVAYNGNVEQLFSRDTSVYHFEARPILHQFLFQAGYASNSPMELEITANQYFQGKIELADPLYQKLKFRNIYELGKPINWKYQLVYSAILIKFLLASRFQVERMTTENLIKHQYVAIRKYNGAGGTQESNYWQAIFCYYEKFYDKGFFAKAKKQGVPYSSPDCVLIVKDAKRKESEAGL